MEFKLPPETVRKVRRSLNETQAEFAKRFSVTSLTVARWETGERACSGLYARQVALLDSSGGLTRLLEIMAELRDLINHPRTQQALMKDNRRWSSLCSAMDVIEDTAMAARSYAAQQDSSDKGKLYLETYGLLQALVLQQDAVFDFCKALGSSRAKGNFPGLMKVRDVRVSVAGHPTKKQREGAGPHFLVQMTLGHGSLEVMSITSEKPTFTQVSLNSLLRGQENGLQAILGGVIC